MLHRNIEIRQDLIRSRHHLKHLVLDLVRIHVKHPDPADLLHLLDLTKQLGKHQLPVVVQTVFGRILRDQSDFLDTDRCQVLHFSHHFIYHFTLLVAANQRNSTIRTMIRAAVADLHIRAPRRARKRTLALGKIAQRTAPKNFLQPLGQMPVIPYRDDRVNFRDL